MGGGHGPGDCKTIDIRANPWDLTLILILTVIQARTTIIHLPSGMNEPLKVNGEDHPVPYAEGCPERHAPTVATQDKAMGQIHQAVPPRQRQESFLLGIGRRLEHLRPDEQEMKRLNKGDRLQLATQQRVLVLEPVGGPDALALRPPRFVAMVGDEVDHQEVAEDEKDDDRPTHHLENSMAPNRRPRA